MQFRLFYRGPLKVSSNLQEKHELRREFHKQLATLWKQKAFEPFSHWLKDPPDPNSYTVIKKVGAFTFSSIVCEIVCSIADLDIIFLRPEKPGSIASIRGDIDNRIKPLLDALRIPRDNEIPVGDQPHTDETPFHCLLEDDALITKLSVTTDRLLQFNNLSEVLLLITVTVRVTRTTLGNIGFA